MEKLSKKLYIVIFIAVFLAVIFVYKADKTEEVVNQNVLVTPIEKTANTKTAISSSKTKTQPITPTSENTSSVSVSTGNITIHLQPNIIFYDALVQAKSEGKIEFSGRNYPGLGFFVTDIGTLHGDNGKNLLYYINGKQASVGVSSYTLKDGDVIEWKLE